MEFTQFWIKYFLTILTFGKWAKGNRMKKSPWKDDDDDDN